MRKLELFRAALVGATFSVGISVGMAFAQAPAAPAASSVAAPVAGAPAAPATTDAAAKPAPALPAGSTMKEGWNQPPKWSEVELKGQYASVPGREMNVLVEDSGQWWREVRNGPLTLYGGILLLVFPALILAFYFAKGAFKLHGARSGKLIERFNSAERVAHWTMAISFVVLAVSGIIIMFGKHFLMPIAGASVFAWITQAMKALHNFAGPLFIFSLVAFFFIYVRDNFFKSHDFTWLSKFGGLLSGKEIPSGRFNGGEKSWFWLSIVVFGILISASGLLLLFPNWNTTRELMAEANLVHGVVGVLFVAASFAHIYMGTIGTEGAYEGMRNGYVDETWAKEHHALWYDDVKNAANKPAAPASGAAQPAAGDD
jgi:formate dehydrogenase subunit gamma